MSETLPPLGPCCICGSMKRVRTFCHLDRKCPTPGRGWGCLVCNLPPDGAIAVVCDSCIKSADGGPLPLKFACRGYPATDGRIPASELQGSHQHDLSFHPEALETFSATE